MSGKFLSQEDAARQLGTSVEGLNRLVDRKKIFPTRDGGAVKFKAEEVERVARELADEAADDDGLVLEPAGPGSASGQGSASLAGSGSVLGSGLSLDSGAGLVLESGSGAGSQPIGGDDDLVLGAAVEEPESIFTAPAKGQSGSRTIVSSQFEMADEDLSRMLAASGPLLPGEAGGEDDLIVAGESKGGSFDDALEIDSIIGSSSPSLPGGSRKDPSELTGTDAGRTMAIDLSQVEDLGPLLATDDARAGGSSPSVVEAGSGVFDSGLSLEADDLQASGLGLDDRTRAGMTGSLAGEAFDLGGGDADEESGSVVIGVEETGESSFFNAADGASGSVVFGDHPLGDQGAAGMSQLGLPTELTVSMPFSIWQVAGLACCAALMFMAACVMLDLTWKIRSPSGHPISTPLLRALADTFGWQ